MQFFNIKMLQKFQFYFLNIQTAKIISSLEIIWYGFQVLFVVFNYLVSEEKCKNIITIEGKDVVLMLFALLILLTISSN